MSLDKVNDETQLSQDITWKDLIKDSETQIKTYREKIGLLNKSIIFFRSQEDGGVPFPKTGKEQPKRHQNKS
jgi:hypothetical protein